MPPRNPFTVLGLPFDATADAIKAAWRRLAREHHPDVARSRSGERRANHVMAEINAAYQELRDPVKRRKHREAAAREEREAGRSGQPHAGRADEASAWHEPFTDGFDNRHQTYGEPTSWVPRSRPRPVTGRIDTSAVFHPRNTVLHPSPRSPLPGLPPRPREAFHKEEPRASDPTGPTHRLQRAPDDVALPTLSEALETRLAFGKFQGRTLREVASVEPTYIGWIVRTIGKDPELLQSARVVQRYLERTRAQRRGEFGSSAQAR